MLGAIYSGFSAKIWMYMASFFATKAECFVSVEVPNRYEYTLIRNVSGWKRKHVFRIPAYEAGRRRERTAIIKEISS